jgi:hypothetical protein
VEINRRAARLARTHPGALQNILSVLPLREKHTIGRACHRNAQKMVKLTHVRHSKLTLESPNDILEKPGRGGSENNIIHIQQQVGSVCPAAIYE